MSELPVPMTPEEAFTENEERLAASIRERGNNADTPAKVGIALAGAFLLYRVYMWRRFREETKNVVPTDGRSLWELNNKLWQQFSMRFAATMLPALVSGYRLGLKQAQYSGESSAWVNVTAQAYANALGNHMNEVSGDALLEGYQAQLNRRIAARAALDRTIDAFGVAPRTMRTLVNVWTSTPPVLATSQPVNNTIKSRADSLIANAITKRSVDIGDTEAHAVMSQAKALIWLYQQQRGDLPKNAVKMWITAKDERVCPICAPMHRKRVPVAEQFLLPNGEKVWAPNVHPRCRCTIVLRAGLALVPGESADPLELANQPEAIAKSVWGVVSKARGDDPYDRDNRGRFSATEQRAARLRPVRTDYMQEEPSPTVSRLISEIADTRELMDQLARQEKIVARKPITTGGIKAREKITTQEKITTGQKPIAAQKISNVPLRTEKLNTVKLRAQRDELKTFNQQKIVSIAEPVTTAAPPAPPKSSKWEPVLDGQPVFGIFGTASDYGHVPRMFLQDDDTTWHSHGPSEYRLPTLRAGIENWWAQRLLGDRVLDDMFDRMAEEENDDLEWEGDAGMRALEDDQEYHTAYFAVPTRWGRYYVDRDTYRAAMKVAVYQIPRSEAPVVTVPADVTRHGITLAGGDDGTTLSLVDIAQDLGFPQLVTANMPMVGMTHYVEKPEPGKHHFSPLRGRTVKWYASTMTDEEHPSVIMGSRGKDLPYQLYYIEPEEIVEGRD